MQTLNHGTISVTVKRVSIHAEVKLVIIQSISTSKLQSTTMSLHDKMHSWTFYSIIKGQTYPTPPYPTSLIPHTLYLTHPIYPTPFQFPSAQSNNVSKIVSSALVYILLYPSSAPVIFLKSWNASTKTRILNRS